MFSQAAKLIVERIRAEKEKFEKVYPQEDQNAEEKRAKHTLEGELSGASQVVSRIQEMEDDLLIGHINKGGSLVETSTEAVIVAGTLSKTISRLKTRVLNQRKELRRLNRCIAGLRYRLIAEQKVELIQKNRWKLLFETSPSGKQLFYCKVCGRISPAPDKTCATIADPDESFGCSKYPNHPKQMSVEAKLAEIRAFAELPLGVSADDALQEIRAILDTKNNGLYPRYVTRGSRILAEHLKLELEDLPKAPQRRNKVVEELIELCEDVKKGGSKIWDVSQ